MLCWKGLRRIRADPTLSLRSQTLFNERLKFSVSLYLFKETFSYFPLRLYASHWGPVAGVPTGIKAGREMNLKEVRMETVQYNLVRVDLMECQMPGILLTAYLNTV